MRNGPNIDRFHVALVAIGWFAMGAFVASSVEHYANLFSTPDGVVAFAGGVVTWAIGAATKVI